MIRNYFKTAWRNLIKNKFISLINLTGLIVGMTTLLFIWQYVNYERSYDQFNEKSDRIFRVRTDRVENGVTVMQLAAGTAGAGPVLKDNLPEIEDYTELKNAGEAVYSSRKGISVRDSKVYFASSSLFSIFSFQLIRGNPGNALEEPFTACISQSTAKKLFDDENPVGKTLKSNGKDEYRITGVFADCPENSHIKFNILLSYSTFLNPNETSFTWDGFFTYLLLKPGVDWKSLENKFPEEIEKVKGEETKNAVRLYLQPLKDIHLHSNYLYEAEVNGDGYAVNFLFLIGIIVLFIAWFNYINLITARSELRAKEVGIRKVIGGDRKELIKQFLAEAGLLNVIAILGSYFLSLAVYPFFKLLLGNNDTSVLFSAKILIVSFVILFCGTLLVSLYPAIRLTSFRPITALQSRNKFTKNGIQNLFSKSLVALQFVGCIGLIACTAIVFKQLNYMLESKLGINMGQTLVIRGPRVTDSTANIQYKTFEKEIKDISAVDQVTGSSSVPGQSFGLTAEGVHLVGDPDEQTENFHVMAARANYSKMFEMKLVAGRYMSDEMKTDQRACLINETGMRLLHYNKPDEAVNSEIEFWGARFKIVGVLKDFHQQSQKSAIEPMIMMLRPDNQIPEYISVKLNTGGLNKTMASIQKQWETFFTDNPFEYFFMDDHFNQQYQADRRFAKILTLFSALAIFISCLGVFALVNFVVDRKRKEIGIRKVNGAKISEILTMLNKDFIKWVAIAFVIATPIAYYAMHKWLENFAYKTTLSWWIFALAGLLALGIALLTVSWQSWRAATRNPVEALRYE